MGLFNFLDEMSPEQKQGMLTGLAQAMQGNPIGQRRVSAMEAFAKGLLGAQQGVQVAEQNAAKRKMQDMPIEEMRAQQQQRALEVEAAKKAAELAAKQQAAKGEFMSQLPGLLSGNQSLQALSGIETPNQTGSGQPAQPNSPQSRLAQLSGGGLTPEIAAKAYAAGIPLETLQGIANAGMTKVKDYKEVRGPNGAPVVVGFDEFGRPVNTNQQIWKAPEFRDLGDRVQAIDPTTMQALASYTKGQSADSKASNAVAWANHNLSKQRLAMDQETSKVDRNTKGAPSGYRWTANGNLEYIPNGPADPSKQSAGAPSEDERKAKGWLEQMDFAIKNMDQALAKNQNASRPSLIENAGILPEAMRNSLVSTERQRYLQASKSFAEAALRAATGAGINESEARQKVTELTPQLGDKPEVIQQKQEAMKMYRQAIEARAGRALKQPTPTNDFSGFTIRKL